MIWKYSFSWIKSITEWTDKTIAFPKDYPTTNSVSAAFPQMCCVAWHSRNQNCQLSSHTRPAASSFSAVSPVLSVCLVYLVCLVYPTSPTTLTRKGRRAAFASVLRRSYRSYFRLAHSSQSQHNTRRSIKSRQTSARYLYIWRGTLDRAPRRCTGHPRYSGTKSVKRTGLEISRSTLLEPCVMANFASWQHFTSGMSVARVTDQQKPADTVVET